MLAKHVENLLHRPTFLRTGVELPIRVCSCPTLAKAVVALAVHLLCLGDQGEVLLTLVHVLAAFQHDGSATQLDESQGCKQSAGTSTHHNRLLSVAHVGIAGMNILVVFRHLVLIHTHGEVDEDGSLAGVDASLQYPHMVDALPADAFLLADVVGDCLF